MADAGYTVGNYLVDRLAEMGLDRVFGVPGDYTLNLLDYVLAQPDLAWTGCTNELNAGYAADGYARVRGGAALLTTFGVGELSAINALAGSFAEHVPVVHIVGSPSVGAQAGHRIVHHSLGDGEFTHFLEMHAGITCATAALTVENAPAEIDRVLSAVRDQRLPGYLLLPADVADAPAAPPSVSLPVPGDHTDPDALQGFVDDARRLLHEAADAGHVTLLAGLLVQRFDAVDDLAALVSAGPLAHATSLWGKSVVDESHPHFLGIYAGAASPEPVRRAVEDAPVLILAGVQFTDLTSGFFSQKITRSRTIEIGANSASVGAAVFAPVSLDAAVQALTPLVAELAPGAEPAGLGEPVPVPVTVADDTKLTQDLLWDTVAEAVLPGDIVIADQGCSFYGAATHRLPTDVTFIGQPLWASIGYTLPALLGACLGKPGHRGVLLIGDGAAQMTIQELSTIFRAGLSPLVVVLDNDGYTVERAIHGADQAYNDIAAWDWTRAPALFAPRHAPLVVRAETVGELRQAFKAAAAAPDQLSLVQAVLPPLDVPEMLTQLARAASNANAHRE